MQERDDLLAKIDKAAPRKGSEEYGRLQQSLHAIKNREQGKFTWIADELARVNWSMVKEYYGGQVADKSVIFSRVVLDPDQTRRLSLAGWAALLFLISGCIVNLNAIAMHGYYRTRLSDMWLMSLPGMGRTIPLARLDTTAKGAPYHLINATFLLFGRRRDSSKAPRDIFTFSRVYCGSERTGFARTEDYGNGSFDLANAVALSGAAVTPTQVQNPLLALLLLLTNSRLGQWLPNPARSRWLPRPLRGFLDRLGPVPLRVLLGVMRSAETRDMCFVSDGGHYENLGLEQLLLRRCRLIVVSDATCDPASECGYFMDVVRRVRCDRGIRFFGLGENKEDLGLSQLVPGAESQFTQAHTAHRAHRIPPRRRDDRAGTGRPPEADVDRRRMRGLDPVQGDILCVSARPDDGPVL